MAIPSQCLPMALLPQLLLNRVGKMPFSSDTTEGIKDLLCVVPATEIEEV